MNNRQSDYANALKHRYRVETMGEFAVGVTTAISILDKPGLKWASSRITADTFGEWAKSLDVLPPDYVIEEQVDRVYREFDRVWRDKADRGNRVHEIADRWTRGETVEVRDSDAGFVDALEDFHHAFKPEFLLTESIVLNQLHGYGGRLDFIGRLSFQDRRVVVMGDYKSGSERPFECAMQAEAYSRCKIANFDESGTLCGLSEFPPIDEFRTVYLREDGTVKMSDPFENISHEAAWEAFQSCLSLHKIRKTVESDLRKVNLLSD